MLPEMPMSPAPPLRPTFLSPAAPISEQHLDLWRAIDRLSPDDAELVVLKHMEGWTYEELSTALDVPRGTVMSRLYVARQRLQALLSGETP